MSAIVLAFDGVLADTLGLRVHALCAAAHAEGIGIDDVRAADALPARAFYECVRLLLPAADETTCDLIALRAQQHYTTRVAQGVDLTVQAATTLHQAQQSAARMVLRADSERRDVERVLRHWEREATFALVRCADDLPRWPHRTSVESSYRAIAARLDALRVSGERRAWENSLTAVHAARAVIGIADVCR